MSRSRHKTKKAGGGDVYSGANSNVIKEAEEKKHGGRVKKEVDKPEGKKSKMRMDKKPRKADGGGVKGRDLPRAPDYTGSGSRGSDYVKEIVKPQGRACGGRVGSDKSPFSSAARPGITGEASKP